MLIWKRSIEVQVADLTVSDLKIELDIRKDADDVLATGTVTISNLSEAHEQQIHDRGDTLVVSAGYSGLVGVIFDGRVQRVEREQDYLTRLTRIAIGAQTVAKDTLSGVTSRSYEGDVSLRRIIQDIVGDLGLTSGPVDAIPADVQLKDWAFVGTSARALTVLLSRNGVEWYEDDGVIRFSKPNVMESDAEVVKVTPETGLVGKPSVTDEGARVRSLLNHRLRPGNVVDLESENLTGMWKIVGVRHHGDNWTSREFYSELDLRRV